MNANLAMFFRIGVLMIVSLFSFGFIIATGFLLFVFLRSVYERLWVFRRHPEQWDGKELTLISGVLSVAALVVTLACIFGTIAIYRWM